jgi:hypothetical protein
MNVWCSTLGDRVDLAFSRRMNIAFGRRVDMAFGRRVDMAFSRPPPVAFLAISGRAEPEAVAGRMATVVQSGP